MSVALARDARHRCGGDASACARADAGYFAPLSDLTTGPQTQPYFALVPYHPDDQAEGTTGAQTQHVDAALPDGREWGICTECGMGRVAAADIPRLLDLHRENPRRLTLR